MTLLDQYFETFNQNDIEIFLKSYRHALGLLRESGRSCEAYDLIFEASAKIYLLPQAITSCQKAIKEDALYEKAYSNLFNIYYNLGLFYSAKKVIKKMSSIFPENKDWPVVFDKLEQKYPDKYVTFYIPCYNVEQYIAQTIEGIMAQSYEIQEILVIDDCSPDQSAEIAAKYPVRIIKHDLNKGLSAARNTALRNARTEFIASVDTDAVPDVFWLERIILAFDNDSIAGVGGRLIEKNTVTLADRWRQIRLSQDHGEAVVDNALLFGSNAVFRTEALINAGGYLDSLRSNSEDAYISNTLLRTGYSLRYVPEAECFHLRKDSVKSVIDTCYNWRKPYWEMKGAFIDIKLLAEKGAAIVSECMRDFSEVLKNRHFDLLYFDFLNAIRSIFKDLLMMRQKFSSEQIIETSDAAYVVLLCMLNKSVFLNSRLIGFIIENISDLTAHSEEKKKSLDDIVLMILPKAKSEENICQILKDIGVFEQADFDYLSEVFLNVLSEILLNIDDTVASMLETTARRIRHEAEHSPYKSDKRVMLLNPPWRFGNRTGVRAGSRWPFTSQRCESGMGYIPYPFFLGYLSSILTDRGIGNVIVDAIAEELTNHEFIERVAGFEPEVVLIETSTASFVKDCLWLLKIKERLPYTKVILTGTHVTALGEEIISENPFIDFTIQGEYELAAAELINALINGNDYVSIKGLLFIGADGNIVDNGSTEPITDIDSLPWPERLTVPIYKYNDLFAGMAYPSLQVHGSRGCPYKCVFCVWPQILYGNGSYRPRLPEKIADEIEYCVTTFGFKSFYFDDDTFNIGKERILKLCQEFVKRGITAPWGAMARADTADYEMLSAMKQAGMVGIKFGVESGVQELVNSASKNLDLEKVEKAMQWCKELGIKTHLTFTFGLPGETEETIDKTIEFAKRLNPDTIQFSITTPFPGTKYYKKLKDEGHLITEEWEKYDGGLHTVIKSDNLTKECLEKAVISANNEFWKFKMQLKEKAL
ncbi:MAG: glycosyltransferase [Nitrospirae bacterium]|nr:glycosyltransferase [Nitrospirota bacterium]